jgi:phosphate uptake regulator
MWRDIIRLLSKDNLQKQALQECLQMLDICSEMVAASVKSLRHRDDASVDIDVMAMDKTLNAFERDVRRKVMTHLSLGHPEDIASGLVLVSVVVDIERIGDYSKNIYQLARQHPRKLHGGDLEQDLANTENEVLRLFPETVACFRSGEVEAARQIMRKYRKDVSKEVAIFERKIVTGEVEFPSAEAAALVLYTRFLKRISAHSRNLVSSLVNPFDRIGYSE